jgi:uncharacterized membrane protein
MYIYAAVVIFLISWILYEVYNSPIDSDEDYY